MTVSVEFYVTFLPALLWVRSISGCSYATFFRWLDSAPEQRTELAKVFLTGGTSSTCLALGVRAGLFALRRERNEGTCLKTSHHTQQASCVEHGAPIASSGEQDPNSGNPVLKNPWISATDQ